MLQSLTAHVIHVIYVIHVHIFRFSVSIIRCGFRIDIKPTLKLVEVEIVQEWVILDIHVIINDFICTFVFLDKSYFSILGYMCVFSNFGSKCVSDSEIKVFKCNVSKYLFEINIIWEIVLFVIIFRLRYFLLYVFWVRDYFLFVQYLLGSLCDLFVFLLVI